MTDKEKQIEEIAKEIESVKLYGIDNYGRKISHDSVLALAEELLKHYQPKLLEGSVVLSKEEWETLHNDYAKALYNARRDERKETAREILKELYEQIDEKTPKWVETQIKMKAKQFGVEVGNDR